MSSSSKFCNEQDQGYYIELRVQLASKSMQLHIRSILLHCANVVHWSIAFPCKLRRVTASESILASAKDVLLVSQSVRLDCNQR